MFCGRDLISLPYEEIDQQTTLLYLNENKFETLADLCHCPNLMLVIADDNSLTENLQLPFLPELHTLSLNKNQINNVQVLCEELIAKAPKLVFLSLVGNPCCPDNICTRLHQLRHQISTGESSGLSEEDSYSFESSPHDVSNDIFSTSVTSSTVLTSVEQSNNMKDEFDYVLYRLRVIYRLPNLQFLDSSPVTEEERIQAKHHGLYLDNSTKQSRTSQFRQSEALPSDGKWREWSRKRMSDLVTKPLRDWLPTSLSTPTVASSASSNRENTGTDADTSEKNTTDDQEAKENVTHEEDSGEKEWTNPDLTPLPPSKNPVISAPKAAYGKCRYVYYGKHSEGNRFITNYDL